MFLSLRINENRLYFLGKSEKRRLEKTHHELFRIAKHRKLSMVAHEYQKSIKEKVGTKDRKGLYKI